MENDETEEETALREIKEETNIDVEIDTRFREVNTYEIDNGSIKSVVFFVGKANTYNVKVQEEEIRDAKWYNYEDALNIISYDADKKILRDAYDYLS